LDENPEEIVDPATIGRGTGELFGFRFELDWYLKDYLEKDNLFCLLLIQLIVL
jgi:hypothetical protein